MTAALLASKNIATLVNSAFLANRHGNFDLAEKLCKRALKFQPTLAEAHFGLGQALAGLGKKKQAVESLKRVALLAPDNHTAQNDVGLLLQNLGELAMAETCYRRSLRLNPDYALAHGNLGSLLHMRGELVEAEYHYRHALVLNPDLPGAHNNLGMFLHDLGRYTEAEAAYLNALQLKDNDAEVHNNLGNTLLAAGRMAEAETSFRRSIELRPDNPLAHNNLGNALKAEYHLKEAEACFRKAIEQRPTFAVAYCNLAGVLLDQQRLADAEDNLRKALVIEPMLVSALSSLLFQLNYSSETPWQKALADAAAFGERVASISTPFSCWPNSGQDQRKLRVGLVSSDFRNHSVGHFLLGPLSHINPDEVDLFAYSVNRCEDEMTESFKALIPNWYSVPSLNDAELAKRIHGDDINVLVDLSGHTSGNRLSMFAWRPAPVQATWLGYLGTTGLQEMDWIIADEHSLPRDQENRFTEKVWRLDDCYICLAPPLDAPEIQAPPVIAQGYITFGSFNNTSKITDQVIEVWSRILQAVPNSKLFIKSRPLDDMETKDSLAAKFEAQGIKLDRLILAGQFPRERHFCAYHSVDIALDTFPYPGVTTTMESLWMGVPVLTLSGERFIERQGVTILTNADLGEWIAESTEDYVQRAVSFANNTEYLTALRLGMRERLLASPLFDSQRFARKLEKAWRGMWEEYCARVNAG